jgi:PAS domain S-box-containing protein
MGAVMNEIVEQIAKSRITLEEFGDFVEHFPALLWRIDIINNRIEYLNRHQVRGLGEQSGLLLQNHTFRRKVVLEEDFHFLEQFMTAVRNGETKATVFRIRINDGEVIWIKVTGTLYRKNPRYYIGYMLDVSDTVGIVQEISESDTESAAVIEGLDYPVLLIRADSKIILAHNSAARELFGYKPGELARLTSKKLFHNTVHHYLNRIYEDATFEKKWEGQLVFQDRKKDWFQGQAVIRYLPIHGVRVFRLSIHDVKSDSDGAEAAVVSADGFSRSEISEREAYQQRLMEKLENVSNMEEILATILNHQYGHMGFDSIIYSDVYEKKNKVVVYTAGEPLEAMRQGETFSYEGTIAENIARYGLDHLIMEDTFSSIKAIDWALFIPHGLRSYFAKPFYERKRMRTVLVICSAKRNQFSEKYINDYALLYDPFLKGLKNWRQQR